MSASRGRSARLAGLVALVALAGCRDERGCVVCGRDECRNLAFTVHLADGGTVETCCPRCALRYIAEEQPAVARLEVRDFASAQLIDARTADYVEGSDVHPCAAPLEGPPKDSRGCCLKAVYDRCLPSALAFADRARAEAFAREHGGFVTTFDALTPTVRVGVSHSPHPPGS
jgi:hypothetical protein